MNQLREAFAQELKELQLEVIKMAEIVDSMLESAIESLIKRDIPLTEKVIDTDDQVDSFNLDIEKKCLKLIACQQPMGRDLRVIASTMRIISDIERMADYTVDIAKFIKKNIEADVTLRSAEEIPKITGQVRNMLKETLKAYQSRDLHQAQKTIEADDIVDELYWRFFSSVVKEIKENPESAGNSIRNLMIGRYLERIADHVTNVAERIHYAETGEFKELHLKKDSLEA